MEQSGPRDLAARQADARAILSAPAADGWVATAGVVKGATRAHLVALSVCWVDERLVVAIEESSRTAKNMQGSPTARVGLGLTRDVVMVDVVVEEMGPAAEAAEALADGYAQQAGWDPRHSGDKFVFVTLAPQRMQVWRESDEIEGRTVMRDGRWL